MFRADDKQILNGPENADGTEFFVHLKEFEMYVKRLVLNPTLYSKIEERMTGSPLNYYYYRLQAHKYHTQTDTDTNVNLSHY